MAEMVRVRPPKKQTPIRAYCAGLKSIDRRFLQKSGNLSGRETCRAGRAPVFGSLGFHMAYYCKTNDRPNNPQGVARHAIWGFSSRPEQPYASVYNGGRAGGHGGGGGSTSAFFDEMGVRTFEEERTRAILSGIVPSARSRYFRAWKQWARFTHGQAESVDNPANP